jgi:hypothetical protein
MASKPLPSNEPEFDLQPEWSEDIPTNALPLDPGLPVTLTDNMTPLDSEGQYVFSHKDDKGTVHFFAVVDVSYDEDYGDLSDELRYYRAARCDDGRLVYDVHSVMPLDGRWSSPLPQLELMLESGDLESAQKLAFNAAQLSGFGFPQPQILPPLSVEVDYAFETNTSEDGERTLEAVKRWRNGSQEYAVRQPIETYDTSEELAWDTSELIELRKTHGLEAAMNLAEWMAVESGALNDARDDPRLFTDGPRDSFITNAERNRNMDADRQPLTTNIFEQEIKSNRFHDHFDETIYHLLEPVDPTVNYSIEVLSADPWTLELCAHKWWFEPDGQLNHTDQPLKAYDLDSFEFDVEREREIAAIDCENLHHLYQEQGLEAVMQEAERVAITNHELNEDRADERLFRKGPPDRFRSLREMEMTAFPSAHEIGILHEISDDDTQPIPTAEPELDSWDELIAYYTSEDVEPERHYWQMHYRPVETPDGVSLGVALFVTEFPQLPPDFDDYIDEFGVTDDVYPTEARTVEMAHFSSKSDAEKFATEFRSYLVPELLDGPELAPEVAKLEGFSGKWQDMNYQEIVAYMSGRRTIVREESQWHLHNPIEEREFQQNIDKLPNDIDL